MTNTNTTTSGTETTPPSLAKRLVNCRHFRWLPGMRCTHRWAGGIRVLADESGEQSEAYVVLPDADGNAVMAIDVTGIMGGFPDAGSAYPFLPDLTDPATLGCLLALVREVVQDPGLHVRCMLPYAPDMSGRTPPPWLLYSGRGARWGDRHDTEAEALVVALETAP